MEASALRLLAALDGAAEAAVRVDARVWFSVASSEPTSMPAVFSRVYGQGLTDSPGRRLSTGAQLRTQDGEAGRRSAERRG